MAEGGKKVKIEMQSPSETKSERSPRKEPLPGGKTQRKPDQARSDQERNEEKADTIDFHMEKDGLVITSVRRKRKCVRDFIDLTSSSSKCMEDTLQKSSDVHCRKKTVKKERACH